MQGGVDREARPLVLGDECQVRIETTAATDESGAPDPEAPQELATALPVGAPIRQAAGAGSAARRLGSEYGAKRSSMDRP